MKLFRPPSDDLFFSRNDPSDPRLGDVCRSSTTTSNTRALVTILGYPDDEGIRLNGGRPGAAEAPDRIRKYLYRMTPNHLSPLSTERRIDDIGNLICDNLSLAERHEAGRSAVRSKLEAGGQVLSFGGGHDFGFADGAGFADFCRQTKSRPLVINFDAHMDVRPIDKGLTSGTPFFRLLEAFPETDFVEIGIQGQCNARAHIEWAKERGARVLTHEEIAMSGEDLPVFASRRLDDVLLRPRPAFISIDIDGFSNAFAPGCSQAWATGFEPESFLRLLQILLSRLDVRVFSLYEVSPALDQDDRTSKLAALLAHRFLYPL